MKLSNMSTKEILEHLLVGYSREQLIEVMEDIQTDWNKLSVNQWELRIKRLERGAK